MTVNERGAVKVGITDYDKIYTLNELAKPNNDVRRNWRDRWNNAARCASLPHGATTHSIVMRSKTGTIRRIETRHDFYKKPA